MESLEFMFKGRNGTLELDDNNNEVAWVDKNSTTISYKGFYLSYDEDNKKWVCKTTNDTLSATFRMTSKGSDLGQEELRCLLRAYCIPEDTIYKDKAVFRTPAELKKIGQERGYAKLDELTYETECSAEHTWKGQVVLLTGKVKMPEHYDDVTLIFNCNRGEWIAYRKREWSEGYSQGQQVVEKEESGPFRLNNYALKKLCEAHSVPDGIIRPEDARHTKSNDLANLYFKRPRK